MLIIKYFEFFIGEGNFFIYDRKRFLYIGENMIYEEMERYLFY